MLIAVPAAFLVQRYHKEVRAVQILQYFLTGNGGTRRRGSGSGRRLVLAAPLLPNFPVQNGIAQRGGQTVQDGGPKQESLHAGWLSLEDFFHKVVKDMPVATREGVHKTGRVIPPPHRDGSHLQPGNPPFGARGEGCYIVGREPWDIKLCSEQRSGHLNFQSDAALDSCSKLDASQPLYRSWGPPS
jgi:hypothetical protein